MRETDNVVQISFDADHTTKVSEKKRIDCITLCYTGSSEVLR